MPKHSYWLTLLVLVTGVSPLWSQSLHSGDPGFGRQWIRSNPFSIQAVSLYPATWDFDEYFGAGMTVLHRDPGNPFTTSRPPKYADARWQATIPVSSISSAVNTYNALRNIAGNAGWLVGDEPKRLAFPDHGSVTGYIRQVDPSQVVYTTAYPINGNAASWYGDNSHPNYTYNDYLNDFVGIIKPDILAYDLYPFLTSGSTNSQYFENLMAVRTKALASGLPYSAWMQSWGANTVRYPSESDNRFNVFTHLTAGYTGFLYWTYDYYYSTGNGLIDANGAPTSLYSAVAQTNGEAATLGKSLRFLTSTDVRFVPGRHTSVGSFTIPNSTPAGLLNWSTSAGGDTHIQSLIVDPSQADYLGSEKNGLIGLFTDDNGGRYFMLTNLNHGANLSAAATSLSFVITFDDGINSIWKLNRTTGLSEEVTLTNHTLNWTLRGGTGDLFKYDNRDFAGLAQSSPGDFDSDGDVDGADFVAWQTHFPATSGATSEQGDADGDGDVDGADFVIWQTHFPTSSSSAAFVPEIPSVISMGIGTLLVGVNRVLHLFHVVSASATSAVFALRDPEE